MRNLYDRIIQEHTERILNVCAGVAPRMDDTALTAAARLTMHDALLVEPAKQVLADFHESLRPKVEALWSID